MVGVEESHGVLVTPHIRDKDAAGAALMLAEFAHHARVAGPHPRRRAGGLLA
ncbi:MAG: hypothetical protein H6740_01345 [Alphaproteobacteria bacterium]|nr:hypothetical protein [Alphaproteobacteria bacterium]